jgi:transcription-repair coupling factor (superfamily II helicase)
MSDIARARGGLSVFVARDGSRASAFGDAMAFFAPELTLLNLPSWDCLPYDRAGPSAGVAARRMAILTRLARGLDAGKPSLLVTSADALLQRLPARDVVTRAGYSANAGAAVDVADLERYFAINGYQRASTVSDRGEFAIRGGVIDVFPPASEEPVRLDLFGDTLESIRAFDRETQRSTRQLKSVDLLPVSEVLLDGAAVTRFRSGYLAAFGAPAVLRSAGDSFRLSSGRRPGRPRPPGARGARRATGDDRRRLRGARSGRTQDPLSGAVP